MQNFILIGYGNLAESMMQGFSQAPVFHKQTFFIYGRDFSKAKNFAQKFPNTQAISSLEEALNEDSILILCIKPKGIESLHIQTPFLLLYSVVAGAQIITLKNHFPQAKSFARAMPNISAKVQKSSTSLYVQGDEISQNLAIQLTQSFGKAVLLSSEDLIDSSIATNGSSPAFLALIAEALIQAGVREGIPPKESEELTKATFEGFSKLLHSHTPQEIKTLITSPAGTTAEGLAYLELKGFKGILQEGAHRAVLKAKGKL